jgi:hypothetical protein
MGRRKGSLNKATLAKLHAETPALGAQSAFQTAKREMDGGTKDEAPRQSDTTPAPAPIFVEYFAPNSEKWRIERGAALLETFGLSADHLGAWHGAVAPEERVWRILRWRFAIAPLLAGPLDADYMVPLSGEDIAAKLSVEPKAIEEEIDAAKAFWVRWQMANGTKSEVGNVKAEEIERSTPTERETALKLHGFSDLHDEEEQLYAFTRINDLKHKLEDEEGKTIAQRCIRVELRIRRNDAIMAKLERAAAAPDTDADKASSLRSDINSYHTIAGDLSKSHLELMKAMNATQEQNPSVQRKVAFVDCLGQITRAMQEYESRGDNTLIDGMFTAAEVRILTTPLSLRPAQYRPDLVMVTRDAMKHENLFRPDYEPPAADRAMYRRMRGAMAAMLSAAENETGSVVEMEGDDEAFGPTGEDVISEVPAVVTGAEPSQNAAPLSLPSRSPKSRPGDDFTISE